MTSSYRDGMRDDVSAEGAAFATLLRDARKQRGLTQDDVIRDTNVSRSTYLRWEGGGAERPDLPSVRMVCVYLGIHPGFAAIALGLMTREELGLPPQEKQLDPVVVEIGTILADDGQTAGARAALRKMLHSALEIWRSAVNMPEPKEPRGEDLMRRRTPVR